MQNVDDILDHLFRLYHGWAETDNLFEIRCLKEKAPSLARRFFCNETGMLRAIEYSEAQNTAGYNVYTIPNILQLDVTSKYATDDDVFQARHHFIDSDETDTQEIWTRILDMGLLPAFSVITGTIPMTRMHVYWTMKNVICDLSVWSLMQKRLAQTFGTDGTIFNPARMMRLAGTTSYPTQRKVARGYKTELTKLVVCSTGD